MLIQLVRMLFGAQNVEVANPAWLSGGIQVLPNLVLPWNRIVIIGFALFVLLLTWLLLNRTRLGLNVRAVTQNRKRPAAGPGRVMLASVRLAGPAVAPSASASVDRPRRRNADGCDPDDQTQRPVSLASARQQP